MKPLRTTRPPFVGRREQLRTLLSALAEVREGHARFVLLVGAAGIGKTTTAERFARIARRSGCEVLWGGSHEWEESPPYRPWVQALRGYLDGANRRELDHVLPSSGELAHLLPELSGGRADAEANPTPPDPTARFRVYDAVGGWLRRLSRRRPVVLVLDDLHWADDSTLHLLRFVVAELRSAPVLVLGTAREAEPTARQSLGDLLSHASARTVRLQGLPKAAVKRLITATEGTSPSASRLEGLLELTEGNPFFVLETAGLWADDRPRRPGDRESLLPESVLALLARRLDTLSDVSRRLVRAASVVGRVFEHELLAAATGEIPAQERRQALDQAVNSGVLVADRAGYGFRHAMFREALYGEVPPVERARIHAALARHLEAAGPPAGLEHSAELAYHTLRAEAILGPEKVVEHSTLAAARALEACAFDEAAVHYRRALERKERGTPDRETASLLYALGRAEAARSPRWNRQAAWNHLQRAAEYHLEHGDIGSAVAAVTHPSVTAESAQGVAATVERVLERVDGESREAGWLQARLGAAAYFDTGDRGRAIDCFERALAASRRLGDDALELRTLAWGVAVDHFDSQWSDVLSKSRRVLELAHRIEDAHAELYARYRIGFALTFMGRVDEADRETRTHLARAESLSDRGMLEDAFWINAVLAQLRGDWARARALSDRGLEVSPRHLPLLHLRCLLEYELGDAARGDRFLQRLTEASAEAGPYPLRGIFTALALAQRADLHPAPSSADHVYAPPVAGLPTAAMLAVVARGLSAAQAGDAYSARRELPVLERGRGCIATPVMAHDRVLGRVALAAGVPDRAAAHFQDSLTFCRAARFEPELAWTCHDYARMLLSGPGGDQDAAYDLVAEGFAIAERLGMRPLAGRLAELRERCAASSAAGLTDRELDVLRLLAQGHTNREIGEALYISPNTVAVHVAHVLAKTGARNRTEAAALAARGSLVGDPDSQT